MTEPGKRGWVLHSSTPLHKQEKEERNDHELPARFTLDTRTDDAPPSSGVLLPGVECLYF